MEGAKWNVEDIVRLAGVDFSSKHYTKYDFCYAVMLIMGEPSTRAYHNAIKRIKYNYEY